MDRISPIHLASGSFTRKQLQFNSVSPNNHSSVRARETFDMKLLDGEIIYDGLHKYSKGELLGKGGFAKVYRLTDLSTSL